MWIGNKSISSGSLLILRDLGRILKKFTRDIYMFGLPESPNLKISQSAISRCSCEELG